jgi:hypothetical protein
MLQEPAKVQRPVPLLHDLTFEAVHALEVETQAQKSLNERSDNSSEIRQKVFRFFAGIEQYIDRLCDVFDQCCNYAITVEKSHPVNYFN